jgi:hypothetical protein
LAGIAGGLPAARVSVLASVFFLPELAVSITLAAFHFLSAEKRGHQVPECEKS